MNEIEFLGIGAQKAATTWLWANLKQHPKVWMPPRKELHYFDRKRKYPSPSFLADDWLLQRLFSQKEHNKLFRKKAYNEISNAYKSKDRETLKWYLKYYLSTYNDKYYTKLFPKNNAFIKGEITPAYSILDLEDVQRVKSLFPDLKIILILRNPIERAWSQIKFYKTRNIHSEKTQEQELLNFIDSPMQELRGDYLGMIRKWQSVFGEKQLFIGFYDDIVNDPKSFMMDIYNFLEIDTNKKLYVDHRVNRSENIEIPMFIKEYLQNKYKSDIEKLYKMFQKEFIKDWV